MTVARQSTARTVTVGPVLDADGVAVTNGVVADFKIAKNGGAPAALNASATLTHRNTGHYSLALTASDLDTVGQAEVVIDDTVNACPVKEITVLEEAVYDGLFAAAATGALPVSAGGIAAAAFAAGAVNAAALAADAVTEIRDAVTGGAYALDTDANGRVRIVDGTGAGELDTASGAVTVATNNDKTGYSITGTTTTLDALQTALNTAHGAGSWATATGFSTHGAADVVTALGTGSTLTALATAAALTTVDTVVDAIKAKTDTLPASFPANFASLAISAGGVASADVKAVNAVTLTGTGVLGDEWGPA